MVGQVAGKHRRCRSSAHRLLVGRRQGGYVGRDNFVRRTVVIAAGGCVAPLVRYPAIRCLLGETPKTAFRMMRGTDDGKEAKC